MKALQVSFHRNRPFNLMDEARKFDKDVHFRVTMRGWQFKTHNPEGLLEHLVQYNVVDPTVDDCQLIQT